MERKTNNHHLNARGLFSVGQMFFFQRWLELLYRHTLDSYQYKLLNAHGAILEIAQIIESVRRDGVSLVNLQEAQAECMEWVRNDVTLGKHADAIQKQLFHHLSQKVKQDNASLLRLKYQVTYALKHLEQYLSWLISDLKDAIDRDHLDQIESLTLSLVSELIRLGRSPKRLYNLRGILDNPSKSFDDRWKSFVSLVTLPSESYVCVFPSDLPADAKPEDIAVWRDAGLSVELGRDIKCKFPDIFEELRDAEYYLSAETNAMDAESAFLTAIGRIGRPLDALTFFQSVSPWPVAAPRAHVGNLNTKRSIRMDYASITKEWAKVEHSPKVRDSALGVINNKRLDERSLEKLHGSLLYAKLSSVSPFQEVRFMNLWVALESLVRTGQHDNIITHVKTVVPAATSVRYFYRLLRNFAEDCRRCEIEVDTPNGILNVDTEPKSLVAEQILSVILDDATYYPRLLKQCQGANHLLAFRCARLRAALRTGEDAASVLSLHHQRVSWHVQRIYRIRNAIAHSAYGSSGNLVAYMKTLREYLSLTITEAIYHLEAGRYTSLEEIFSAIEDNHDATVETLKMNKAYDPKLLLNGALFCGN